MSPEADTLYFLGLGDVRPWRPIKIGFNCSGNANRLFTLRRAGSDTGNDPLDRQMKLIALRV